MNESSRPPGAGALERLLAEAAQDPLLAERLQRDPLVTAEERGVPLSPTERALLESMEPTRLNSMLQTLSARGVQPPGAFDGPPDPKVVSLGIRVDPPPMRDAICTGIRADHPSGTPPKRPSGPSPEPVSKERRDQAVKGDRPGRRGLKVAAAAAATVTVLGVGTAFLASAGSRPHRPATTAPQATPDAGVPDAGADAGDTRAGAPPHPAPDKGGSE